MTLHSDSCCQHCLHPLGCHAVDSHAAHKLTSCARIRQHEKQQAHTVISTLSAGIDRRPQAELLRNCKQLYCTSQTENV